MTEHGTSHAPRVKALIVAPAWIGDTVMAQPLFARLHAATPGLQLDALAPRWVAPVLERMPEIWPDHRQPLAHGELALSARFALARRLARGGYQRLGVLPNSLKSALIPALAGIPERIGFTGESRYGLINRRHTLDTIALPQMAERFAQLAEAPGKDPLPRPLPLPRLTSSPEQQAATLAALDITPPEKIAVFCPGAEYGSAKRWPARHFAALAEELATRGFNAVAARLAERSRGRRRHHRPRRTGHADRQLLRKTSLSQAIDLIAAARFVVCNDSGLMHVAAALERP